jgi:hypothetical protein
MKSDLKIAFVGGCFTQQANIQKLSHETVLDLLAENSIYADKVVVRYGRVATCFEKIEESYNLHKFNFLVFHLRPESIFNLTKVYVKYRTDSDAFSYAVNLPACNKNIPVTRCAQRRGSPLTPIEKKGKRVRNILRNLNYTLGYLAGNWHYAMKQYLGLLDQIVSFCEINNVKLMITTSIPCPNSRLENRIAKLINSKFEKFDESHKLNHVNCFRLFDDHQNYIFNPNNVHVNQYGHDLIGRLISEKIIDIVNQ